MAAVTKITALSEFSDQLTVHSAFPLWLSQTVVAVLPWLELTCGFCLLSGWALREAAVVGAVLLLAFTLYLLVLRPETDCHCLLFPGALPPRIYLPALLARNVLTLTCCLRLAIARASVSRDAIAERGQRRECPALRYRVAANRRVMACLFSIILIFLCTKSAAAAHYYPDAPVLNRGVLMRLTLRTLLAYLDDTLEPTEIKQIGQKVAESDAAQELIARIKQVTRKRRLTTPPLTGPNAKFDPNIIAEYLDNELTGEQVAEIEKVCLESDVHLAEIASCHQILTLVLGEPALVPPTARERMYGLVKGREAIPFRKASAKNPHAVGKQDDGDAEETAVLGLPVHKRHAAWLKWAIPIAGLFLFLALGVALFSALSKPNKPAAGTELASRDSKDADKANADKDNADKDIKDKNNADKDTKDKDKNNADKDTKDKDKNNADKDTKDKDKNNADKDTKDKDKNNADKDTKDKTNTDKPTWPTDRPKEPSKDRREIARFQLPRMGANSILVSRQRDQEGWSRVMLNQPVFSTDSLVSLPGLRQRTGGPPAMCACCCGERCRNSMQAVRLVPICLNPPSRCTRTPRSILSSPWSAAASTSRITRKTTRRPSSACASAMKYGISFSRNQKRKSSSNSSRATRITSITWPVKSRCRSLSLLVTKGAVTGMINGMTNIHEFPNLQSPRWNRAIVCCVEQ